MKRFFTPLLLVLMLPLAGCATAGSDYWQSATYSGSPGGYVDPPGGMSIYSSSHVAGAGSVYVGRE